LENLFAHGERMAGAHLATELEADGFGGAAFGVADGAEADFVVRVFLRRAGEEDEAAAEIVFIHGMKVAGARLAGLLVPATSFKEGSFPALFGRTRVLRFSRRNHNAAKVSSLPVME
jgi:hypothetical protein